MAEEGAADGEDSSLGDPEGSEMSLSGRAGPVWAEMLAIQLGR
jgi:hypothetical protein